MVRGEVAWDSSGKYRQVMKHMGKADTTQVLKKNPLRWPVTCLKRGRGVGGALAVVRDGYDMDRIFLATFECSDVAAGGR